MIEHELTAAKAVEEFCKEELSDYSYFNDWKVVETESHGGTVFVDVEIRDQTVRFKVGSGMGNPEDCKLEVDMAEDSWQTVETYSWKVKYFWIALLRFPD